MRMLRLLLLPILLVGLTVPALAASGKISVLVLDETGAPFPGVVVTLASTRALQSSQSVPTNREGKAIFGVVQPGEGYKITVEITGYQKIEEPNISVGINSSVQRAYKLQQQQTETVKVIGERPMADLDAPTGSMSISAEFFQDLPILGRNYQSALTLAPGVNDADGDGNPNVHGARDRDFKATLDGVSNVDPLTGTFMSNINPDAIEEIEVVTTGADASYGRAVGGFANIITKQGSNDFEGAFKMIYQSSILDGNGASSLPDKDFEFDSYQPSISVTGRIIRDKLFYAANHEYHDIGVPTPIVGGSPVVVKYNYWRHFDKLTWQVSPRNKLNLQYSADPYEIGPFGVDSRTRPESGFDYTQGGPTYLLDWQTPISPNFSVKSLAAWSDTGITLTPLTRGIKNGCGVDIYATPAYPPGNDQRRKGLAIDEDYCLNITTAFQTGSFFLKTTDNRQRLTLRSDATLFVNNFLGREHSFEFGVIGEDEHYDNDATYWPSSLFGQGLFTRDAPPSSGGPGGPPTEAGTIFRTVYSPGAPTPIVRSADGLTLGVYLQDTFRPHPNVNVKVGARLERENVTSEGRANVNPTEERSQFDKGYKICAETCADVVCRNFCASIALGVFTAYEGLPELCSGEFGESSSICQMYTISQTPLRQNENIDITNWNFGPRLSVQWDPKGDGKTKIFGTYAKIYDKVFLAVPVVEQGPEQFATNYFVSFESDPRGEIGASALDSSSATVSQLRSDLRTPYVHEYTLGVSREIANETLLTLQYIKRDYQDLFQDRDINHVGFDLGNNNKPCVPIAGTAPPIYTATGKPDGKFDDCMGLYTSQGQRPDGIADLKVINPFFNQIFEVGNYNSSHYTAYELEIVRRLYQNWQLEASYVWSEVIGDAEDYLSQLGDDPTTTQDERGYLSYDQTHVVKINAVTHLPVWGLKLGTTARWESGQPFSLIRVTTSEDIPVQFGSTQPVAYTQTRRTYPTGQRNDHRNQSFFTLGVNLQRDFQVGKVNITGGVEVVNLLNDDRLYIADVTNGRQSAGRRFGREFQMSMKLNF